ncbi:MAG: TIGR03915 family putative DNA repair protein [Clostridia bacterium]|nr:TIGR03915 family putative DNA repair protein [Clostridia bacterium]
MITFLCDSSFEGLLTAVYFAHREDPPRRVVSGASFQTSIGETLVPVETDYELYGKMESYISSRCGVDCLMAMYRAYLSGLPGIEDAVFRFFRVALVKKEETPYMHLHPDVAPVLEAQRTVSRESHKMLGFIRFRRIAENLLYAAYSPTANVTPLVAPHFADRMNSYSWIIHDVTRDIFAVYNGKECVIGHSVPGRLPPVADIDADYEDLWRAYFDHVAIAERRNLRLQMSLMPKKYWKYLTEKQTV